MAGSECWKHADEDGNKVGVTECWIEGIDPTTSLGDLKLYIKPTDNLVLRAPYLQMTYYKAGAVEGNVFVDVIEDDASPNLCYSEKYEFYNATIESFNDEIDSALEECTRFYPTLVVDVGL